MKHTSTSSVLVEAAHYETIKVTNIRQYIYVDYYGGYYVYDKTINNVYKGTVNFLTFKGNIFYDNFYTYTQVWVPDRCETVTTSWYTYPDPVWITTGVPGQVSTCFVSIADVMIGAVYVSRPLIS